MSGNNGNGNSEQQRTPTLGIERSCYCGHSKAIHQPACRGTLMPSGEPCGCPAFLSPEVALARILEQGFNNLSKVGAMLTHQAARLADAVEKLQGSKIVLPPGH